MAGTYSPTVTSFVEPVLEVQSLDSTDYETIQSSLSTTAYVAQKLYLNASNSTQLNQVVQFETYDSDGEIKVFSIKPDIDPFQKQTSFNIDLTDSPLIFDGKLKFDVELLPNSNQQFDFEAAEVAADSVESIPTEDGGFEYKPLSKGKRGKLKIDGYDKDFLNRSGFFPEISSTIPKGHEVNLDNLFDDWCDEL